MRPSLCSWVARLHAESGTVAQAAPRNLSEILRDPTVRVAMGAMVFAQVVMAMLMVITSLHMKVNHHSLAGISVVVSVPYPGDVRLLGALRPAHG